MSSSSRNTRRSRSQIEWVWFCSNCNTGPLNPRTDRACPDCDHRRCEHCPISRADNAWKRIVAARPPSPELKPAPKPTSTVQQAADARTFRQAIADIFANNDSIAEAFSLAMGPGGIGAEAMTAGLLQALQRLGKSLKQTSSTSELNSSAEYLLNHSAYISDVVRMKYDPSFVAGRADELPSALDWEVERSQLPSVSQVRFRLLANNYMKDFQAELHSLSVQNFTAERLQGESLEEFELENQYNEPEKLQRNLQEWFDSLRKVNQLVDPQEEVGDFFEDRKEVCYSLPEMVDRWFPRWLDLYMRPPIPAGMNRFEWTCTCGKMLYDDYKDLSPRKRQLLRRLCPQSRPPGNTPPPPGQPNMTGWTGRASSWAKATMTFATSKLRQTRVPGIPLHNPIAAQSPGQTQAVPKTPRNPLFLLLSLQAQKEWCAKVLRHADVELSELQNDKALFKFLRERYHAERKPTSWFTLRTVSRIGNCRVLVDLSNFIQSIKIHTSDCPTDSVFSCRCWPDEAATGKYRYIPQTPTEPFPVERNYLLHYFRNPDCLDDKQFSVLCYMPLKKDHRLVGEASKPVVGWGIDFEENWHRRTIYIVITVLGIMSGVAFGFTWWLEKSDFSGGWGVGSFIVASATLMVTVLGLMAHSSY